MKKETLTLPSNFDKEFEKFMKRHAKDAKLGMKLDVKFDLHGSVAKLTYMFDCGTVTLISNISEASEKMKVTVNTGNLIKGIADGIYVTDTITRCGFYNDVVYARLIKATNGIVAKHAKERTKLAKKAAKAKKCCKDCCGHCKDGKCSCGHCKKSK